MVPAPTAHEDCALPVSQRFASGRKRVTCLVSGAFRMTAAGALNAEFDVLPIHLRMEQIVKGTVRM